MTSFASATEKAARWGRPYSIQTSDLYFLAGSCRSRGFGSSRRLGRSGNAGLGVVGLHHGLGDIHRAGRPQNRARLAGDIQNHREAILLGILVQNLDQLLADAVGNLVLLRLDVRVRIFVIALQQLLLGVDLLQQLATGLVVQLVALGVELLLQLVNFLVQVFQFAAASGRISSAGPRSRAAPRWSSQWRPGC